MKETIICGIAAALCVTALSTSAFAVDITEDTSIFAENPEELVATIKGWPEDNTFLDPKTIMPIYCASINDYIRTGKLNISETDGDGCHHYISDLVDGNGNFLGVVYSLEIDEGKPKAIQFISEYGKDPLTYEKYKVCSSVDFRLYGGEIKSLLLANGIDPDVKEVKFLSLNGVGSVYYINNGTNEVLVKTRGLERSPYPGYFEGENSDIIVLNEEFRQKAARIVEEERKAYEKFKNKYGEDAYAVGGAGGVGNPDTGAGANPNAWTVGLALLSVSAAGAAVVSGKRGKSRR